MCVLEHKQELKTDIINLHNSWTKLIHITAAFFHSFTHSRPVSLEWDVLHATLQLSNHRISMNTGRLPHRQGATSSARRLSGVHELIAAQRCFPVSVFSGPRVAVQASLFRVRSQLFPLSPAIKWEEGLKDESEYGCCYSSYRHGQYPLWSISLQSFVTLFVCQPVWLHLSCSPNVPLSVSFYYFLFIGT